MATGTQKGRLSETIVLRDVPYRTYVELVSAESNRHVRMAYLDGTLEIMSPIHFRHERPSRRFALLIYEVTTALQIPCSLVGSTTFHRAGDGPKKGAGREPDESFYIGSEHLILARVDLKLDAGDPPPDLWIEVDNRASSARKLPLYARLGVPEVWRYRVKAKTLWFGRLAGETYEPIDRSLSLPMLTPALALEGLAFFDGVSGPVAALRLRDWIRATLDPPGPAGA